MTSIIHPSLHARNLATSAQSSLATAAATLRGNGPTEPMDGMVGIPEHNGPDTPDNPWFIGNHDLPVRLPAHDASAAVDALSSSLGFTDLLSKDVVRALTNARDGAKAGLELLVSPPANVRVDRNHVALTFDSASMWASLAVNLIDLEMGRPMPKPLPPIKPLPAPAPGEPGSPITIQPIEVEAPEATQPVEVEAPEATQPVQVEAPEAIGA